MLIGDALAAGTRTLPRGLLGVALATVAPVVITRVRGGTDLTGALVAASLFAGAGAGYVVDDPAARTLAPSPTPLVARRLLRGVVASAGLISAWLIVLSVAAASGQPRPSFGSLATYGAVAAAIAVALASRFEPDGATSAGLAAAGCSLIAVLVIGLLSVRYAALPSLTGEHPGRWWLITLAAGLAAARGARDPAAARRRRTRAQARR